MEGLASYIPSFICFKRQAQRSGVGFGVGDNYMLWPKILILVGAWTIGFNFQDQMIGNLIQILLGVSLLFLVREYIRARRVNAPIKTNKGRI